MSHIEGLPDLTPKGFISLYMRINGGASTQECTRIEFSIQAVATDGESRDAFFARIANYGRHEVKGDGDEEF